MAVSKLTLAQQIICKLSPQEIGITDDSIAAVSVRREQAWEESPKKVSTCACPLGLGPCKFFNGNHTSNCVLNQKNDSIANLNTNGGMTHVVCLLTMDLDYLMIPSPIKMEVEDRLANYHLKADPNTEWVPQRVFTLQQQNLMDCHLTEIGIAVKDAEALEDHAEICTLRDLLQLNWSRLMHYAGPDGIPNFGPKAIDGIRKALRDHGFACHPQTDWVREQDVEIYIKQEMRKMKITSHESR